ncbi:hypothetical protein [Shewanella sp. UCD-KL12]|uniref:hypothetical protein n=1 Tax=Shewanella sp. UCD-KL12 TaxID=1917163 RepID=UPI000970FA27|nr:hypothetical protein [Shewanella sp. UCD-KL12]
MKKTITLMMLSLMLIYLPSASVAASSKVSHVSINAQQFILGGYPKIRLNIVSQHENLDKMQFVLTQGTSEERLMVKPINNFLLLVTGVEDVVDPDAMLVIREYRVNKWRDIKSFELFKGQELSPELATRLASNVAAEKKLVQQHNIGAVNSDASKSDNSVVHTQQQISDEYRGALVDDSCTLNYTSDMTLWRIGTQQSKAWGISTYGAILAIFEANKKAFLKGRIDSLRADVPLLCPSLALRDKYADSKVAKAAFEAL